MEKTCEEIPICLRWRRARLEKLAWEQNQPYQSSWRLPANKRRERTVSGCKIQSPGTCAVGVEQMRRGFSEYRQPGIAFSSSSGQWRKTLTAPTALLIPHSSSSFLPKTESVWEMRELFLAPSNPWNKLGFGKCEKLPLSSYIARDAVFHQLTTFFHSPFSA